MKQLEYQNEPAFDVGQYCHLVLSPIIRLFFIYLCIGAMHDYEEQASYDLSAGY